MEITICIEGQNGLTWRAWQRFAQAVENLGFAGLLELICNPKRREPG
jgi:hypothetical protein